MGLPKIKQVGLMIFISVSKGEFLRTFLIEGNFQVETQRNTINNNKNTCYSTVIDVKNIYSSSSSSSYNTHNNVIINTKFIIEVVALINHNHRRIVNKTMHGNYA